MRTLEQALKVLAEKMPAKFGYHPMYSYDLFFVLTSQTEFALPKEGRIPKTNLRTVTQDDIDEILAEIGWEYWIERIWDYVLNRVKGWQWNISEVGQRRDVFIQAKDLFPTKLEATHTSLIAVVEELWPGAE